jgi:hypothetical protein
MSPYYLSYLREKSKSNVRYSSTIYLYTVQTLGIATSTITAGVLKNKYKFSLKLMAFVGTITMKFKFYSSKIIYLL